jgi:hypothetical protein
VYNTTRVATEMQAALSPSRYLPSDVIQHTESARFQNITTTNCPEVYRVLVGKPEGRRPLGRPRRRWEDGIRMDLEEIGWGGVEWIHLAQDRDRWRALVNAVMNLRVLGPRS